MIKETHFTLPGSLEFTSIFWISSLSDEEIGSSKRIIEDLENACNREDIHFRARIVNNRAELIDALDQIIHLASLGHKPIIHFDMHGSKDEGLYLSKSGEFLAWNELVEKLRKINTQTRNNLVTVFACCFAYYQNFEIELKLPTPFYIGIAPEAEVYVDYLENQTMKFYSQLFGTSNITASFENTLSEQMTMYHCEETFMKALAQYINQYCVGKTKKARTERLLSERLKAIELINPSKVLLKQERQHVKEFIKPSQKTIDFFAPKFLIGKEATFTFSDVKKLADAWKVS